MKRIAIVKEVHNRNSFFHQDEQLSRALKLVFPQADLLNHHHSSSFKYYDVIFSIGLASKYIQPSYGSLHVNFLTKLEEFWYRFNSSNIFKMLSLNYFRILDRVASESVGVFLTPDSYCQKLVFKLYRKKAFILHPPFLWQTPSKNEPTFSEDFYLWVGHSEEEISWIKPAFKKMAKKINFIKPNGRFLQSQADLFKRCKALIVTKEHGFSGAEVKAVSLGKPILALRNNCLRDLVIDGVSGLYFDSKKEEILADGIRRMEQYFPNFNKQLLSSITDKFTYQRFKLDFFNILSKIKSN